MYIVIKLLKIVGFVLTGIGLSLTILMFRGLWPSLLYPLTLVVGILLFMLGYAIEKPVKD